MEWMLLLMTIQTGLVVLMFMLLSGGVSSTPIRDRFVTHVASILSKIIQQDKTETATVNVLSKSLGNERTVEAATEFVKGVVVGLLNGAVEELKGSAEGRQHSSPETELNAVTEVVGARPSDRRALAGSATIPSQANHVKQRLDNDGGSRRSSLPGSSAADKATDAIVLMVLNVLQDERVKDGMINAMAEVLKDPKCTAAISQSVSGVGSNVAKHLVAKSVETARGVLRKPGQLTSGQYTSMPNLP